MRGFCWPSLLFLVPALSQSKVKNFEEFVSFNVYFKDLEHTSKKETSSDTFLIAFHD